MRLHIASTLYLCDKLLAAVLRQHQHRNRRISLRRSNKRIWRSPGRFESEGEANETTPSPFLKSWSHSLKQKKIHGRKLKKWNINPTIQYMFVFMFFSFRSQLGSIFFFPLTLCRGKAPAKSCHSSNPSKSTTQKLQFPQDIFYRFMVSAFSSLPHTMLVKIRIGRSTLEPPPCWRLFSPTGYVSYC